VGAKDDNEADFGPWLTCVGEIDRRAQAIRDSTLRSPPPTYRNVCPERASPPSIDDTNQDEEKEVIKGSFSATPSLNWDWRVIPPRGSPIFPCHESKHQDPWASWSITHVPLYQSSPADRTFPRSHASPTAPAFPTPDDFATPGRTGVDDAEAPTAAFPACQASRLIAVIVLLPVLGHLSSAPL
jgi:hypothetical protein